MEEEKEEEKHQGDKDSQEKEQADDVEQERNNSNNEKNSAIVATILTIIALVKIFSCHKNGLMKKNIVMKTARETTSNKVTTTRRTLQQKPGRLPHFCGVLRVLSIMNRRRAQFALRPARCPQKNKTGHIHDMRSCPDA